MRLAFTAVLLAPLLAHAEKHDVCLYLNFDGQFWDASPSRTIDGVTFNDEFE